MFGIFSDKGQALSEYSILLGLLALVAAAGLLLMSGGMSGVLNNFSETVSLGSSGGEGFGDESDEVAELPPHLRRAYLLIERMREYYREHGRWPRGWPPHNYRDIGLNPDKWGKPRRGLIYNPAGNRLGLTNAPGDKYQVYVTTPDGERLHVADGESIWYNFDDGQWYYGNIRDNVPVDISTLEIVKEKPQKPPKQDDPEQPGRPEKPDKPDGDKPDKPEKPDEDKPDRPDKPEKPDEDKPDRPDKPEKPDEDKPDRPDRPEKPDEDKPDEQTSPTGPISPKNRMKTSPTGPTSPKSRMKTSPTGPISPKNRMRTSQTSRGAIGGLPVLNGPPIGSAPHGYDGPPGPASL
ncbi:MAG: hypothetical protein GXP42_00180 [Chloroflexi bacterium]|nr:hypothetical protein [Chloroflexota bacterium]